MPAKRRSSNQDYIYGNTVRAQQPSREETTRRHPLEEYTAVRRNREKALNMDLPLVVIMSVAVACVLLILVNYLHIQSSISSRIYNIEQLESQLEQLKTENDALEIRINTDIDLDHIYQVATEELGMVYANRDQVILYDKTESEYVRQYENIPE